MALFGIGLKRKRRIPKGVVHGGTRVESDGPVCLEDGGACSSGPGKRLFLGVTPADVSSGHYVFVDQLQAVASGTPSCHQEIEFTQQNSLSAGENLSLDAKSLESKQASRQAGKQASKQAGRQASKRASE